MSIIDRRFLNISLVVRGVVNEPEVGVPAGTQYIVGDTPAGAFAEATAGQIARYDGSNWVFTTPTAAAGNSLEVLDISKGQLLKFDGTEWVVVASLTVPPVLDIVPTGASNPATCAKDDKFLNTSDFKLYVATDTDTWNSGTALTAGDRYASSTDKKIYVYDGEEIAGDLVLDGASFLNKNDGCLYVYDKATNSFARVGHDLVHFVETHTLTDAEATAKEFDLTYDVATGQEANVLIFVSGVAQAPAIDFSVAGKTVSWTGKGLESVGMAEGDLFIVYYIKA